MKEKNVEAFFLLPSLSHGGAQKVFLDLQSGFEKEGIRTLLVVLERDGELLERVENLENVLFLDSEAAPGLVSRLSQFMKLRKLMKRCPDATVYSTVTGMNVFTLVVAKTLGNKNVIIREASTRRNLQSRFLSISSRFVYRFASKIICTSELIKREFISDLRLDPSTLHVLANPVNPSQLIEKSKLPHPRNIFYQLTKSSGKRFLAVGRLVEAKGFDVLIYAFKDIAFETGSVLTIVGEGPLRSQLESIVNQEGLKEYVYLAGYQSNPYPFMASADIFVLSSLWEGYVNVLVEAAVFNLKFVVTDCGSGPGDWLKQNMGLELIPAGDVRSMSRALLQAVKYPANVDYSHFIAQHDLHRIVQNYQDIADV